MPRMDGRANDQLRPVEIIPNVNKFAEGSCLIRCGNTHVLCTASVEERTPPHVPEGEGWVTAEYSMLPRANRERSRRDICFQLFMFKAQASVFQMSALVIEELVYASGEQDIVCQCVQFIAVITTLPYV